MYQNYTTMETALTLKLVFTIPEDHEARLISQFVDSIPTEIILEDTSQTGRQLQTAVNLNWEYFKHQVKENLESTPGKEIYAQRKIDIETVFGRMKCVFGMRRTHVRGKQSVYNDIGMMLMSMNLTKLALEARRRAEAFRNHFSKSKKCTEVIQNMDNFIAFFII